MANTRLVAGASLFLLLAAFSPAGAQNQYQGSDPNLRNFYMARQQIQIIDESPVVTNSTNPAGANQAAGAAGGAGGRAPLPRAGFNSYMQSMPQSVGPLPKVENGVPKAPPPPPKGFKANAGKLQMKAKPVISGPSSYSSYKGYGGNAPAAAPVASPAMSSGSTGAERNVKGDVLHWSRQRRSSY